jgi:protein SCO1/2
MSKQWHFVTGNKEGIFNIAQNSYRVSALKDKTAPGGLVHSGAFLLIDSKRRLRGHYDGTKAAQVDKLLLDIEILLNR